MSKRVKCDENRISKAADKINYRGRKSNELIPKYEKLHSMWKSAKGVKFNEAQRRTRTWKSEWVHKGLCMNLQMK